MIHNEREFLHDMASPLGAAMMLVGSALECVAGEHADPEQARLCLERAGDSMLRLRNMVNTRRKQLGSGEAS